MAKASYTHSECDSDFADEADLKRRRSSVDRARPHAVASGYTGFRLIRHGRAECGELLLTIRENLSSWKAPRTEVLAAISGAAKGEQYWLDCQHYYKGELNATIADVSSQHIVDAYTVENLDKANQKQVSIGQLLSAQRVSCS